MRTHPSRSAPPVRHVRNAISAIFLFSCSPSYETDVSDKLSAKKLAFLVLCEELLAFGCSFSLTTLRGYSSFGFIYSQSLTATDFSCISVA